MFRAKMAITCVALVALLGQPFVPAAAAQESLADVVERCEQAVVKIVVEGNDGASLGSGFVVDPSGTLVTNFHVLAGAQKATATFPNGTSCEITGTLLVDEARDICIAKLDGSGFATLTIAAALPRKGERVTALGSPQGLSFSASQGIVSAIRPAEELGPDIGRPEIQGTWIQVDAALSSGNSGGPLINDRGEVVGMSTLASQGGAQNLNFGVSGADILKLHEISRNQTLVALPQGVGKMERESSSSPSTVSRPPIPKDKLEKYVSEGRAMFDDLLRGMRSELYRTNDTLKEMRRGKAFLPPGAPAAVEVMRVINARSSKANYFYRNQSVKDREVNRVQTRVRELQNIEKSAKDASNNEHLFTLLSKYGPRLDARREGSIGFMFDAVVAMAFDDHGVIVLYEDVPYLLWVESAAGLSEGVELTPAPVFVAGTQTLEIPGQAPRVLTLLMSVTEDELRSVVFGDQKAASAEWRVWKDNTGKFQIEAMLVKVTDKDVVLKKRNGSTVNVPLDRLSTADRQLVGK